MNEIYVSTEGLTILEDLFRGKDMITIEQIIDKLDEINFEKNSLQDDLDELQERLRSGEYILKSDYYH